MALKQADRLESNNPKAYGIAKAIEITGHKSVADLAALYAIPDAILSDSKVNTGSDAIGQSWYVVSEGVSYQLIDWDKRKTSDGWKKTEYTTVDLVNSAIKTLTDRIAAEEAARGTADTTLQTGIDTLAAKTINGKRLDSNPELEIPDFVFSEDLDLTGITPEQAHEPILKGDTLEEALKRMYALIAWSAEIMSEYLYFVSKGTGLSAPTGFDPTTGLRGSFDMPDLSDTNYLGGAGSLVDGLKKLDTNAKGVSDDLGTFKATKGVAGGLASLDDSGKVPSEQLPSYVDDVLDIYATYTESATGELSDIQIFSDAAHTKAVTGETGKIYVNVADGEPGYSFRWSGTQWIHITSGSLVIGTVSGTAYDGASGALNRAAITSGPGTVIADLPSVTPAASKVTLGISKATKDGLNYKVPAAASLDIPAATSSLAGVMTGADKTNLEQVKTRMDGIYEGNKAMPVPVISGAWSFFDNSGTAATITPTPDASNPKIEKGYKASFSGTYRWTAESGKKNPTQIQAGSSWTTITESGVNSATYTSPQVTTNTTVKIGLQAEKTGLMVSGSSVVPASGFDTTNAQKGVTFMDRLYYGKSTTKVPSEAIVKALTSELVSGRSKTIDGISCTDAEYYIYAYPSALGGLSTIIQDGATPVLGAFTLSKVTITNAAGLGIELNVYVSNNPGAFTSAQLKFT